MTVNEFLADKAAKTERALAAYIETWTGAPEPLVEAVRYSLFAGGKRLRPALALGAAEIVCASAMRARLKSVNNGCPLCRTRRLFGVIRRWTIDGMPSSLGW
jgi:geranylgeranyl pyrophosphate synthase